MDNISEGSETSQNTRALPSGNRWLFCCPENERSERSYDEDYNYRRKRFTVLLIRCAPTVIRDGNCILLDDGEAHRCVQLISIYGIYCNYFKKAVLLADKELYEQLKSTTN